VTVTVAEPSEPPLQETLLFTVTVAPSKDGSITLKLRTSKQPLASETVTE